ncbi:helix-turn-helix domain-containing protein [Deferrisoma palaeochoriense]
MARPVRIEFPGATYLVTAKALPRRRWFRTADEAAALVVRLPEIVDAYGVRVHAACVLPDHYHLLLETPRANLSRAVHRWNTFLTARVKAEGPILRGRFRALLIDPEDWLVPLSVRVHLNPVRRGLADHPAEYPASSARAYWEPRAGMPGVWTRSVLSRAGGREAYRKALEAELATPSPPPWKEAWRGLVLGGDGLRQRALALLGGRDLREFPGFGRPEPAADLDAVVARVAEYTGFSPEQVVRGKFQRVLARKLALYLARKYTGLTLREIGERFGLDYTSVHMAVRRTEERRRDDPALDAMLRDLEASLAPEEPTKPEEPVPAPEPAPEPKPKRRRKAGEPPLQLKLF